METNQLFQNLDSLCNKYLDSLQIDCECFLFKRQKVDIIQNSTQSSTNKYEQTNLKIQIRGNYVLQLNSQSNKIISGFNCNIDKKFKLLRSHSVMNHLSQNDPQSLGQLIGIEFRSLKFEKKHVFLYLPLQNKFQNIKLLETFAQILGKKYILQDGFHETFRAIKKIGKGVTASVYKAIRLTDQKQFAVKSFKKQLYFQVDNGRGKAAFQKQFKTMTQIDSDYICKLISVYQSDNSIYIVMQLLSRSLFSHLKIHGGFTINKSKDIIRKLLIGLEHLHSKNIMHRDLKLQNIMISEKSTQIQPKIIDFGLAQISHNEEYLYLKCGTPGYVAPEILSLKTNDHPRPPYSCSCDIFSMGVIFYILLQGKTIFEGVDEKQVIRKNKQCQIDYDFTKQKRLTSQMKDLLRKMLQKDPTKRARISQLLNHQFCQKNNSSSTQELRIEQTINKKQINQKQK